MGPYSHFIIASYLENHIKPHDVTAYYWGSVAPDVRYLVPGMNRRRTHLPTDKLQENILVYPELEDFLKGYMVHCICDHLDILQIIQHKFPFNLQKNNISKRQGTVILELFNIFRVKTPKKPIEGGGNDFLRQLGVNDSLASRFAEEVNHYVNAPSLRSTVAFYQGLGFTRNGMLEKYRETATSFQRNWLQKNLVLFGLEVGKVNKEITASVQLIYPRI